MYQELLALDIHPYHTFKQRFESSLLNTDLEKLVSVTTIIVGLQTASAGHCGAAVYELALLS